MYDPAVVDAFLRVRDQIEVAAPSPQLQKALGRIQSARDGRDDRHAAGADAAAAG